jgi:hypothetical protein
METAAANSETHYFELRQGCHGHWWRLQITGVPWSCVGASELWAELCWCRTCPSVRVRYAFWQTSGQGSGPSRHSFGHAASDADVDCGSMVSGRAVDMVRIGRRCPEWRQGVDGRQASCETERSVLRAHDWCDVTPDMRIFQEELFDPSRPLSRFPMTSSLSGHGE